MPPSPATPPLSLQVLNTARERPLAPTRSRIPSWLHMAHIGQPAIASWGDSVRRGAGAPPARLP
jgi:hypothetical protein